jgi:WD40 repeat protein
LSATLLETSVRLWDVQRGSELRRFAEHEAGVRRAEFSPDGRWAVSGDEKGIIKAWGINPRDPVDTFRFQAGQPVWGFHGNVLAVLTDKGIGIWDLQKRQWAADLGDPGRKIDAMEFLDDGRQLLSLSAQALTLWSLDPPAEIITIPGEEWMAEDLPRIVAALNSYKNIH